MGYQVYRIHKDIGGYRFAGYGVPAICEYPKCNEEIDRGVSYACGGEPNSEYGCDRYFCSKHLNYTYYNPSTGKKCRHKKDCECDFIEVCEKCEKNKDPFPYKYEHIDWIKHILTDESWEDWREEEKDGKVIEYKSFLTKQEIE